MSASLMQLPSSSTSAAGVEGGAFCDLRPATRGGWPGRVGLVTRLGGSGRLNRLRAGVAMCTDILRHETLAVHSA